MKEKKRIEYIDLAKGLCIMLVVLNHCADVFHLDYSLYVPIMSFRMPLYFCLSGLFFKEYNGFWDFFKRKTNKLLLPFLFFFTLTNIIIPILSDLFNWGFGQCEHPYRVFQDWVMSGRIQHDIPIWFLWCLFMMNTIFYIIVILTKKHSYGIIFLILFILGYGGYVIGNQIHNNYHYIGTAFTALPFFGVGYIVRKKTSWLSLETPKWILISLSIFCFMVVFLFSDKAYYIDNTYNGSYISVVICGVMGSIGIISISKAIVRLPIISYWGRYSIIILCIHYMMLPTLQKSISTFAIGWPGVLICFAIVMFSFLIIIPIMRKYLPWVVAQKDLIK